MVGVRTALARSPMAVRGQRLTRPFQVNWISNPNPATAMIHTKPTTMVIRSRFFSTVVDPDKLDKPSPFARCRSSDQAIITPAIVSAISRNDRTPHQPFSTYNARGSLRYRRAGDRQVHPHWSREVQRTALSPPHLTLRSINETRMGAFGPAAASSNLHCHVSQHFRPQLMRIGARKFGGLAL